MSKVKIQLSSVGEIRKELSSLSDDCEVNFTCEHGDLVFCRVKSRHRDESGKTLIISFELGDLDEDTELKSIY